MPRLPSEVINLLAAAKLSPEQLVIVNKIITMVSDPIDKNRVKSSIRQARWRARRRLNNVSVTSTVDVSVTSTQHNKINGVARVEDNPLLPSSPPPEGSKEPSSGGEVAAPKKSARRPHRIPEGWQPSDKDRQTLLNEGATPQQLDRAVTNMTDWAEAKGITRPGWDATYRGWVRRDLDRQSTGRPHNGQSSIIGHNRRVIEETFRRVDEADKRRREKGDGADLFLIQGRSSTER